MTDQTTPRPMDPVCILLGAKPEPPAAEQLPVPEVGQRYVQRSGYGNRIVTVTRVWDDKFERTAVAYQWRDGGPGVAGSACPLDVFHRAYELEQPAAPDPATTIALILNRLDRDKTPTGTELRSLRSCVADMQAQLADTRYELDGETKRADRAEAERDGAYRERAHLLAWLATHYPAVTAPALDVDEPGWQLLYLTAPTGQLSWHIAPRDSELFAHVPHVAADDPRAQWDGHTTEQKYERIRALAARVAEVGTDPDRRDPAMAALAADLRWAADRLRREHPAVYEDAGRHTADGILRAADLLDQWAGSAAGEQP